MKERGKSVVIVIAIEITQMHNPIFLVSLYDAGMCVQFVHVLVNIMLVLCGKK